MDQSTLDQAREWVAVNKPGLSDEQFDAAVIDAARDIAEAEAIEQARVRLLDR